MSYTVLIGGKAEKFLEQQTNLLLFRLEKKILALTNEPMPTGCVSLEGVDKGFRVRVGDYCILYTIDELKKEVIIFNIDKRGQAYRNL